MNNETHWYENIGFLKTKKFRNSHFLAMRGGGECLNVIMYRVKENLNNFLYHVKINDTIKYVEKIEVGKVSVEETF
jgi:hypothetical protein